MTGKLMPMRIGDVEVLVEAVGEQWSEDTSALDEAGKRLLDAFAMAREVIVGAAIATAETAGNLAARSVRPDKLEVEFGLGYSIKGNVVVVSGHAESTLKVKLTYDAPDQDEKPV
ncbi:CU044_2847 family protein [Lentzea sp. NPDC034063]|uniref:CU044_2847 family protein n=1 Tax=unclassified Lentzea TaxID=2643253 RepID=UPI0033C15B98